MVETFGRLDILVNNAAVAWQGRAIDGPEIDNEAMDRQWTINTFGVIANIRAAANPRRCARTICVSRHGLDASRAGQALPIGTLQPKLPSLL
ncbi:hypothetical protein GCM10011335_49200 [Aureimonas glaciei]|uniref:Uncharacterized protein n=1 Tax=Aureimonas glaciei TaxID=1776957 RepID=A0A917DI71_9HYPH|nr:hypothetical protein GCM10011335_49200 [Aureimonas glaciei]